MKNVTGRKRILPLLLLTVLLCGLAACGKAGEKNDAGASDAEAGPFVWAAEWTALPSGDLYRNNYSVIGNRLYYSQTVYKEDETAQDVRYLDLTAPDAEPVVVLDVARSVEEGYAIYIYGVIVTPDEGIVTVVVRRPYVDWETADEADYERAERETAYILTGYGADGAESFSTDITQYVRMDPENAYLQYIFADGEGTIYLSNGSSYVWIFDRGGAHTADVSVGEAGGYGYISSMGVMGDGRAALFKSGEKMELCVYNVADGAFSDTYSNLPPQCWNAQVEPGIGNGVFLTAGGTLYNYDPDSQSYEAVLTWLDCDMNPDYVQQVCRMEDGRLAVIYRDWESNEESIVLLSRVEASGVTQKTTITLGCMGAGQDMQAAVVKFNRENELYRVEIRDYYAAVLESTDGDIRNAYADAKTQFYNDLIAGTGPDLFVTNDVNMKLFAAKGLIEDLNPYLDKSSVVSREDLIGPVLDAYTVGGRLLTIPGSFLVSTLVGRRSELGEPDGWTMDELMEYAAQYPDAAPIANVDGYRLVQYCLMCDMDSYVNWETGECFFDTEQFKKVLAFAAMCPPADYEVSLPKLLAGRKALLDIVTLSDPQSWQVEELLFGEPVTAIGFPSASSTGVVINGNGCYSISASSDNKDAAWAFIESTLRAGEQDSMFRWGFPIRKAEYDAELEEAMKDESHSSYGWDDVTFEIYAVKQEEADRIWEVIGRIDGVAEYWPELMEIIQEEIAPYFEGQKNVEEVADIIQRRVSIYINESR